MKSEMGRTSDITRFAGERSVKPRKIEYPPSLAAISNRDAIPSQHLRRPSLLHEGRQNEVSRNASVSRFDVRDELELIV